MFHSLDGVIDWAIIPFHIPKIIIKYNWFIGKTIRREFDIYKKNFGVNFGMNTDSAFKNTYTHWSATVPFQYSIQLYQWPN